MRAAQFKSNLVGISLSGFILILFGLITLITYANHNQALFGRTLSYTIEAAVLFDDIEAIDEGVRIIAEQGGLSKVSIFDREYNELYSWEVSEGYLWYFGIPSWIKSFMLRSSHVSIMHDGQVIGYVDVTPSAEAIFLFLFCGFLIILLTLLLGAILSNFEMNRLHKELWQSIDEIVGVARTVATDKSFHLRASRQSLAEFRELAEGVNFLLDEIESYKEVLEEENHALNHKATHDSLTGLANRLHFESVLKAKLHRSLENNNLMALLYLDGFKFKLINDKYGHRAGDDVLIETAQRLSSIVRKDDLLARLGGDEFAILVSNIDLRNDLQIVIDKIIGIMEYPIKLKSGEELKFMLNIGAAIYPLHGKDMEIFIEAADQAMYAAKKSSKKYHVYDN